MYAVTCRNKILAVCFGTLVLARLTMELVTTLVESPTVVDAPPIPTDVFNFCTIIIDLRLMLIPNSIGIAFGA